MGKQFPDHAAFGALSAPEWLPSRLPLRVLQDLSLSKALATSAMGLDFIGSKYAAATINRQANARDKIVLAKEHHGVGNVFS